MPRARSLLLALALLALAARGATAWTFAAGAVTPGDPDDGPISIRPHVARWGQAAHDDPLVSEGILTTRSYTLTDDAYKWANCEYFHIIVDGVRMPCLGVKVLERGASDVQVSILHVTTRARGTTFRGHAEFDPQHVSSASGGTALADSGYTAAAANLVSYFGPGTSSGPHLAVNAQTDRITRFVASAVEDGASSYIELLVVGTDQTSCMNGVGTLAWPTTGTTLNWGSYDANVISSNRFRLTPRVGTTFPANEEEFQSTVLCTGAQSSQCSFYPLDVSTSTDCTAHSGDSLTVDQLTKTRRYRTHELELPVWGAYATRYNESSPRGQPDTLTVVAEERFMPLSDFDATALSAMMQFSQLSAMWQGRGGVWRVTGLAPQANPAEDHQRGIITLALEWTGETDIVWGDLGYRAEIAADGVGTLAASGTWRGGLGNFVSFTPVAVVSGTEAVIRGAGCSATHKACTVCMSRLMQTSDLGSVWAGTGASMVGNALAGTRVAASPVSGSSCYTGAYTGAQLPATTSDTTPYTATVLGRFFWTSPGTASSISPNNGPYGWDRGEFWPGVRWDQVTNVPVTWTHVGGAEVPIDYESAANPMKRLAFSRSPSHPRNAYDYPEMYLQCGFMYDSITGVQLDGWNSQASFYYDTLNEFQGPFKFSERISLLTKMDWYFRQTYNNCRFLFRFDERVDHMTTIGHLFGLWIDSGLAIEAVHRDSEPAQRNVIKAQYGVSLSAGSSWRHMGGTLHLPPHVMDGGDLTLRPYMHDNLQSTATTAEFLMGDSATAAPSTAAPLDATGWGYNASRWVYPEYYTAAGSTVVNMYMRFPTQAFYTDVAGTTTLHVALTLRRQGAHPDWMLNCANWRVYNDETLVASGNLGTSSQYSGAKQTRRCTLAKVSTASVSGQRHVLYVSEGHAIEPTTIAGDGATRNTPHVVVPMASGGCAYSSWDLDDDGVLDTIEATCAAPIALNTCGPAVRGTIFTGTDGERFEVGEYVNFGQTVNVMRWALIPLNGAARLYTGQLFPPSEGELRSCAMVSFSGMAPVTWPSTTGADAGTNELGSSQWSDYYGLPHVMDHVAARIVARGVHYDAQEAWLKVSERMHTSNDGVVRVVGPSGTHSEDIKLYNNDRDASFSAVETVEFTAQDLADGKIVAYTSADFNSDQYCQPNAVGCGTYSLNNLYRVYTFRTRRHYMPFVPVTARAGALPAFFRDDSPAEWVEGGVLRKLLAEDWPYMGAVADYSLASLHGLAAVPAVGLWFKDRYAYIAFDPNAVETLRAASLYPGTGFTPGLASTNGVPAVQQSAQPVGFELRNTRAGTMAGTGAETSLQVEVVDRRPVEVAWSAEIGSSTLRATFSAPVYLYIRDATHMAQPTEMQCTVTYPGGVAGLTTALARPTPSAEVGGTRLYFREVTFALGRAVTQADADAGAWSVRCETGGVADAGYRSIGGEFLDFPHEGPVEVLLASGLAPTPTDATWAAAYYDADASTTTACVRIGDGVTPVQGGFDPAAWRAGTAPDGTDLVTAVGDFDLVRNPSQSLPPGEAAAAYRCLRFDTALEAGGWRGYDRRTSIIEVTYAPADEPDAAQALSWDGTAATRSTGSTKVTSIAASSEDNLPVLPYAASALVADQLRVELSGLASSVTQGANVYAGTQWIVQNEAGATQRSMTAAAGAGSVLLGTNKYLIMSLGGTPLDTSGGNLYLRYNTGLAADITNGGGQAFTDDAWDSGRLLIRTSSNSVVFNATASHYTDTQLVICPDAAEPFDTLTSSGAVRASLSLHEFDLTVGPTMGAQSPPCLEFTMVAKTGVPSPQGEALAVFYAGGGAASTPSGYEYPADSMAVRYSGAAAPRPCALDVTVSPNELLCQFSDPLDWGAYDFTQVSFATVSGPTFALTVAGVSGTAAPDASYVRLTLSGTLAVDADDSVVQVTFPVAGGAAPTRLAAHLHATAATSMALPVTAPDSTFRAADSGTGVVDVTAPTLVAHAYAIDLEHKGQVTHLFWPFTDPDDVDEASYAPVAADFVYQGQAVSSAEYADPPPGSDLDAVFGSTAAAIARGFLLRLPLSLHASPNSLRPVGDRETLQSPASNDNDNPYPPVTFAATTPGRPADAAGNVLADNAAMVSSVTVVPPRPFAAHVKQGENAVTLVWTDVVAQLAVAGASFTITKSDGTEAVTVPASASTGGNFTFERTWTLPAPSTLAAFDAAADAGVARLSMSTHVENFRSTYHGWAPTSWDIQVVVTPADGPTGAPILDTATLTGEDTVRVTFSLAQPHAVLGLEHLENYRADGRQPSVVTVVDNRTVELSGFGGAQPLTAVTQVCVVQDGTDNVRASDLLVTPAGCIVPVDQAGPAVESASLALADQSGGVGLVWITLSEGTATPPAAVGGFEVTHTGTATSYQSSGFSLGCAYGAVTRTCRVEFASHAFTQAEADSGLLRVRFAPGAAASITDAAGNAATVNAQVTPTASGAGGGGGSAYLLSASWATPGTHADLLFSADLDRSTPTIPLAAVAVNLPGASVVSVAYHPSNFRAVRVEVSLPAYTEVADTAADLVLSYVGTALQDALTGDTVQPGQASLASTYLPRVRDMHIDTTGLLVVRLSERLGSVNALLSGALVPPANLTLASSFTLDNSAHPPELRIQVTAGLPEDGATYTYEFQAVQNGHLYREGDAAVHLQARNVSFVYQAKYQAVAVPTIALEGAETRANPAAPDQLARVVVTLSSAMASAGGSAADWLVEGHTVTAASVNPSDTAQIFLDLAPLSRTTGETPHVSYRFTSGTTRATAVNTAQLDDTQGQVGTVDAAAPAFEALGVHEGSPVMLLRASEPLSVWDIVTSPVVLTSTGGRPAITILGQSADSRLAGYATVQLSRALVAADQGQLVFALSNATGVVDRNGVAGDNAQAASLTLAASWAAATSVVAATPVQCTTHDTDGNGLIDEVRVEFTGTVLFEAGQQTLPWHVGDHAAPSAVAASGTMVTLTLVEEEFRTKTSSEVPGVSLFSGNTDYTPALSYSAGTGGHLKDAANAPVQAFRLDACVDRAPPVLTHVSARPSTSAHAVDLYFSERVVGATGNAPSGVVTVVGAIPDTVTDTAWPADLWTSDTHLSLMRLTSTAALSASGSYSVALSSGSTLADAAGNRVPSGSKPVTMQAGADLEVTCTAASHTEVTLTFSAPVSALVNTSVASYEVFRTALVPVSTVAFAPGRTSATLAYSDVTEETGHPPWVTIKDASAVADETGRALEPIPYSVLCPDTLLPSLVDVTSRYEYGSTEVRVGFSEKMDLVAVAAAVAAGALRITDDLTNAPLAHTFASAPAHGRYVVLTMSTAVTTPRLRVRAVASGLADPAGNSVVLGDEFTLNEQPNPEQRPRMTACEVSDPTGLGFLTHVACDMSLEVTGTSRAGAWLYGTAAATSLQFTGTRVTFDIPAVYRTDDLRVVTYDYERDLVLGGTGLQALGVVMVDDALAPSAVTDLAAPVMRSLESFDAITTELRVGFSEAVTVATTTPADQAWTLNPEPGVTLTPPGVAVANYSAVPTQTEVVLLTLTAPINATALAGKLRLLMSPRSLVQDAAGNTMVTTALQPSSPLLVDQSDGPQGEDNSAGPKLVAASCLDVVHDGKLEQCTVQFETVVVGATQPLAWHVNGRVVDSVLFTPGATDIRLLLSALSTPVNTAAPMVTYDAAVDARVGIELRDQETNALVRDQAITPQFASDVVQPVLVQAECTIGSRRVRLTYSEPLVFGPGLSAPAVASVAPAAGRPAEAALTVTGLAEAAVSGRTYLDVLVSRAMTEDDAADGAVVFASLASLDLADTATLQTPSQVAVLPSLFPEIGKTVVVCQNVNETYLVDGISIACGQNVTFNNTVLTTVCQRPESNVPYNETVAVPDANVTLEIVCPPHNQTVIVAPDDPAESDAATTAMGSLSGVLSAVAPFAAHGIVSSAGGAAAPSTGGPMYSRVSSGGRSAGGAVELCRETLYTLFTLAGGMGITWAGAQSVTYQAGEVGYMSETALFITNWVSGAVGVVGLVMMHYSLLVDRLWWFVLAPILYVGGSGAFAFSASVGREDLNAALVCGGTVVMVCLPLLDYFNPPWAKRNPNQIWHTSKQVLRAAAVGVFAFGVIRSD